jgi:hypothetical protein
MVHEYNTNVHIIVTKISHLIYFLKWDLEPNQNFFNKIYTILLMLCTKIMGNEK